MDLICGRTRRLFDRGKPVEVLTVDNHADGPYLYLKLLKEDPARAAEVLELLEMNEGNSSGRGIGCVSWDGAVHADQFWRHTASATSGSGPSAKSGRTCRPPHGQAQRQETTRHRPLRRLPLADVCGGNFRVRAEAVTGDLWAPDPACYLTDEEIS